MASANITAGFKPETVELLHGFAAYVDEIDGTEATPTELALSLIEADGRPGEFRAEQIVGAVLAEHRRFQRWLRDRRTVLMQDGWQAGPCVTREPAERPRSRYESGAIECGHTR